MQLKKQALFTMHLAYTKIAKAMFDIIFPDSEKGINISELKISHIKAGSVGSGGDYRKINSCRLDQDKTKDLSIIFCKN